MHIELNKQSASGALRKLHDGAKYITERVKLDYNTAIEFIESERSLFRSRQSVVDFGDHFVGTYRQYARWVSIRQHEAARRQIHHERNNFDWIEYKVRLMQAERDAREKYMTTLADFEEVWSFVYATERKRVWDEHQHNVLVLKNHWLGDSYEKLLD